MTRLARSALIKEKTSSHRVISEVRDRGSPNIHLAWPIACLLTCCVPPPHVHPLQQSRHSFPAVTSPLRRGCPPSHFLARQEMSSSDGSLVIEGKCGWTRTHLCPPHSGLCSPPPALLLKWGADVVHIKVFAGSSSAKKKLFLWRFCVFISAQRVASFSVKYGYCSQHTLGNVLVAVAPKTKIFFVFLLHMSKVQILLTCFFFAA